jgi:hypothetical protein
MSAHHFTRVLMIYGRNQRGQKVLLGTSAGLFIAGVILEH